METTPATLDQIRAAIKPLEWEINDYGTIIGKSSIGVTYEISAMSWDENIKVKYHQEQDKSWDYAEDIELDDYSNTEKARDAAKVLCQAHYEELVMKAF